ncbi:PBP1A family penicillin-binding protein [Candidatus Dependentiae bacterium]|nr:PBP1A family penicillin-binding protein [Candidatus Dependentiae bacterium]
MLGNKNLYFRYVFTFCFLLFSFCIGAFLSFFEEEKFNFSALEITTAKPSIILDDEGKEFAKFELDKRELISFNQLPKTVIDAFVAAEDWNFFNHYGISLKGILRSLITNICLRKKAQGASTITQQLARLMFLHYNKTIKRKLQEIFLALQLEKKFSKHQILEIYLNSIYFGRGIYGIEAACRRFWNKSVTNVTLDEAATLAAVAKSAYLYSPLNAPLTAKKRRNIILGQMKKLNLISQEEYDNSIDKELIINDHISGNSIRLYIIEWIRNWAESKWGKDTLYTKGLKIKTTINTEKQNLAENIFRQKIQECKENIDKQVNGAMIAMESSSGKIKALIGGCNFQESQFNRAFQSVRQIGSTFKPIIYAAALKNGFSMDDILIDEPFELEMPNNQIWKPRNWTHTFEGPMTLVRALTLSNNIVTIKLFLQLGATTVIEWARKFGLKNEILPYPSLALGTAEATVFEMVAAFNIFANYGKYIKPYFIEWIKNEWNNKIWEKEEIETWEVLDIKTNSKMINALSHRIKRAKILLNQKTWLQTEAIGKTGATNDASSTWFVGSTPELTTCIYVGRDDNKPLGQNVYANKITFPIWLDFNKSIKFEKKYFYIDPTLKEITIDWFTGLPTSNLKSLRSVSILK